MQYLNDVWELIQLKDAAFKKTANDKYALKKYIKYYVLVMYVLMFLLMSIIGIFVAIFSLAAGVGNSVLLILLFMFLGLLILPWILLLLDMFSGLVNHFIAVLLGGKANSFWDFYKAYHYPRPLRNAIALVPILNLIAQIYTIWDFAMLYKSLVIVHKLPKRTAGWFVGIKAGIVLVSGILLFIAYFGFIVSLSALG
ncbi:MAG: hypothetical protein ABIG89_02335 [Candidatus Woesearchaeota archaeon]